MVPEQPWVPTVDVSALRPDADPTARAACVVELGRVCKEKGFFYAAGHGVNAKVLDSVREAADAFFALPKEEKRKIDNVHSYAFRGYIAQGVENTAGVPDEREQIEFGNEADPIDDVTAVTPYYFRLQGPNQWPSEDSCPGFRACIDEFVKEMEELSRRISAALAEVLGLPTGHWDHLFSSPHMQMKICRYPGMNDGGESVSGVGAHSDSGFLTILLQDISGLQVQTASGNWEDVTPIPNTLVVNLGEMLQLASGGHLKATVHRVLRSQRTRISIPFFWNPRLDATITDLAADNQDVRASTTHGGANAIHAAYGVNAFKSLARSHPHVLATHHPDLALNDQGQVVSVNE